MDRASALTRALAAFHVVQYGIQSLYDTPSSPTVVPTVSILLACIIRPVPSDMCPPLLLIQFVRPVVTITTINDVAATLGTFDPFKHSLRRNSSVSIIHDLVSPSEAVEVLNFPGSENDTWILPFWRSADAHNIEQACLILIELVVFGSSLASPVTIPHLKQELNTLRIANGSLEKSSAQKSAAVIQLDVENFVLEDANSQMETLLATHSGDKAALQLDLHSAQASLENETMRCKDAEDRARNAELELVKLKSELAEYQQPSKQELESSSRQVSELQEQLQDAGQVKEQANIQIMDLQQQLAIVQADIAKERDTMENLTSAAVEMEMGHQSTIHDVRSHVAALESTLATAEAFKTAAIVEVDNLVKKLHSVMDSRVGPWRYNEIKSVN